MTSMSSQNILLSTKAVIAKDFTNNTLPMSGTDRNQCTSNSEQGESY